MWSKLIRGRLLLGLAAAVALITALACGSAEEVATPVPASEIGAMVSKAVSDSMAAQQPGMTAAQMEAAVSKSVQAASAGQLSAADVQRIVDSSIRAIPAP